MRTADGRKRAERNGEGSRDERERPAGPDHRPAASAASAGWPDRRTGGDRRHRARDRPDARARVPPPARSARRRFLREPDPERCCDHARDARGHGGAPHRRGWCHSARPAARRRGVRLHFGIDGDRRAAGVRPYPRGAPGVACTTPITAAFAAFSALDARRLALLTRIATTSTASSATTSRLGASGFR